MRSSRLVDELVKMESVSVDAAKKRVSRARTPIHKLSRLLPKNEAFLYHQDDYQDDWQSERFWGGLIRDLRETRSIYGLALYGLIARGGRAHRASFDVICGSPQAQKKQIPLARVLQTLTDVGLVKRTEVDEMGECVSLTDNYFSVPEMSAFRARTIAENFLMDSLREWARKLGLASYNAVAIRNRDSAPEFATFHWDLRGPSYLLPFVSIVKDASIPGFFVADVFCDSTLDVPHIQYLLRKVYLLKAMPRIRPFLPVLLADGYTREALREGRRAGVLMATTENLFGKTVAYALTALIDVLTRAAEVAVGAPERIAELLGDLGAIEGAAGNLRGALFEMIVGHLVREGESYSSIDIGKIVHDPKTGKLAEIDVLGVSRRVCWVYECKGYQPGHRVSADEIENWLERVARILRYCRDQERFRGHKFGFEFWTTGQFEEDALQLLEKEKRQRVRTTLGWRDGQQVKEYARELDNQSILKTLNEHYFRHPVANLRGAIPGDDGGGRTRNE